MKSNDLVSNSSVDQYLEFRITSSAFVANGDSYLFSIENPHIMLKLQFSLPASTDEILFLTFSKNSSTSFSEL